MLERNNEENKIRLNIIQKSDVDAATICIAKHLVAARLLCLFFLFFVSPAQALIGGLIGPNAIESGQLYQGFSSYGSKGITDRASLEVLESALTPIDKISLTGGSYWLKVPLRSDLGDDEWVVYIYGSYIENVQAYLLTQDPTKSVPFQTHRSGHQKSSEYPLHYGMTFSVEERLGYVLWVNLDSRYFSGDPRIEIKSKSEFNQQAFKDDLLVIGCLGAIIVLATYNFMLFLWVRSKEYLYYAVYLVSTFTGWAAVFAVYARLFNNVDVFWIMLPFYGNVIANTFFYQKFLDLSEHNKMLSNVGYGVAVLALLMAVSFFFVPYWMSYLFVVVINTLWLSVGFLAGVVRWREGYKPSRFFVLGFSVVLISGGLVIFPYFGFPRVIYNEFLWALVAQTLDVVFLAWALANRINLLKEEKEGALKTAHDSEQYANTILTQANETLLTSLQNSEKNQERKDEFIMAVSHELRTPLNVISGSLEQMKYTEDPKLLAELRQYIQFGSDRLSTQVENIVTMAETDHYEVEPHKNDVRLKTMVSQLQEESSSYLYQKPVVFDVRFLTSLSDFYIFDEHLVHRVLAPVVDNACKYTEEGKVLFEVGPYEQGVKFVITDTGPGVSEEIRQTIFDSFVQASQGYQRTHEGLGLGLSISQRLVHLLGGDIEITSPASGGSCFTVRVPMDASNIAVDEGKAKAVSGHALIVEDNQVNAKVLTALVKRIGLSSDLAENGEIAVQAVKDNAYDVIFMDLQMPVMDGFAATVKIRKNGNRCPIIAVTANSDYQARIKCWDVGMNDFVSKPVKKAIILDAVTKWMCV